MDEQLACENQGLGSTSVTAEQFLGERLLRLAEVRRGVPEHREPRRAGNQQMAVSAITPNLPLNESNREVHVLDEERGGSRLDRRRVELEQGAGGDHDKPYTFTLPTSQPQALAWMKLRVRVQHGAVQS